MKCNCQDWDDESPCQFHNPKLARPEVVYHQSVVVNIWRRLVDKKYYYTICIDTIRVFTSPPFDTKKQAVEAAIHIPKHEATALPSKS